MDTQHAITDFLQHLEGLGHAATTMDGSRDNLNFFAEYLRGKGVTDLLQITAGIIADYKQQVMSTTLAVTTKQKRLRTVARLFTWLKCTHALLFNPAEGVADNIRVGRRIMPILTTEEVQKLLAQPDLNIKTGLRNRAIMELFYSSALRRSELCRLKLHDLDLAQRDRNSSKR